MQKTDILLPIYNSYEQTKNCIESILMYTPENTYNLFLLDDKSPDERIESLTEHYSEKYSNIIAVRNAKNLGFPGNVNNGFTITENDVVVLNSDTLVSENWLEKLTEAAYSEEKIAAVNPMSNYGIISGLPTANTEINDLFSFSELQNVYQRNKETGIVETPLLIGYCIYIRRSALNEVGIFDAETFKRGYGEESDWCMRAREKGLKLIVSKESYVHHIGGVSFGAEKEKLRSRSREILIDRYPQIDKELETFIKQNHFKRIRKGMMQDLNFLRKDASPKVKLKMIKHFISNTYL